MHVCKLDFLLSGEASEIIGSNNRWKFKILIWYMRSHFNSVGSIWYYVMCKVKCPPFLVAGNGH